MATRIETAGIARSSEDPLQKQLLDAPDRLFDLLPLAVYICAADGRIVRFNRRAAELWGRSPRIGAPGELFCGSQRLYGLDGAPLAHSKCPMAEVLKTGIPAHDREVVIERPDGSRIVALANINPVRDSTGKVIGAINCFHDTAAQERAEARLRESERQARELLAGLPVALYTTDAEGRITLYNEAAAELWGCRPELDRSEWCGSWRLYRPDGRPMPHDESPMAIALKEGRPIRGAEAVMERPDGTRVPFLPYPTPLRDESGALVGAVNMLIDISERKRAEEEIRESQTLAREHARSLEAINRINTSLAAELDLDRLVQAVTDAATELVGAAFGAFFYNVINEQGEAYMLYALSGAPREAFSKFPLPRNTAIFDPTFRGAGPVVLDDVTKDPRYGKNAPYYGMPEGHLPVRSYLAVPVVLRSGEVIGGLFFGHPEPGRFTERDAGNVSAVAVQAAIGFDNARAYQQAQKALEERERIEQAGERLARIVESSDDGILSLDLDGVIVSWNKGAERLYGYSAEEAVGTPVTMLIPQDRQDEEGSILDRIRRGERIEHYETVRRRKDGTLLEVSLTVSPVQNADGRTVGASKIARDITERRRLQRHQELLLAELNHRVKNMLAVVAAIASQTARATTSMDEFREAFSGRLGALGRTYTLLTGRQWQAAPLTEIVEDALQPHLDSGSERVRIAGRDLTVRPKATLTLGMILHELVTNASKYGALSVGRGRISVEWQVVTSGNGSEEVHLRWREEGMAGLRPPPKMGFGTWLIETSARHELGGVVDFNYHPFGLECDFRFPSDRLRGEDDEEARSTDV